MQSYISQRLFQLFCVRCAFVIIFRFGCLYGLSCSLVSRLFHFLKRFRESNAFVLFTYTHRCINLYRRQICFIHSSDAEIDIVVIKWPQVVCVCVYTQFDAIYCVRILFDIKYTHKQTLRHGNYTASTRKYKHEKVAERKSRPQLF